MGSESREDMGVCLVYRRERRVRREEGGRTVRREDEGWLAILYQGKGAILRISKRVG
jgi:hypothetical protein